MTLCRGLQQQVSSYVRHTIPLGMHQVTRVLRPLPAPTVPYRWRAAERIGLADPRSVPRPPRCDLRCAPLTVARRSLPAFPDASAVAPPRLDAGGPGRADGRASGALPQVHLPHAALMRSRARCTARRMRSRLRRPHAHLRVRGPERAHVVGVAAKRLTRRVSGHPRAEGGGVVRRVLRASSQSRPPRVGGASSTARAGPAALPFLTPVRVGRSVRPRRRRP